MLEPYFWKETSTVVGYAKHIICFLKKKSEVQAQSAYGKEFLM